MSDPDSMAISRAIDALKDPTAQAVVVAIIDRVQGMIGNQEMRGQDDRETYTAKLNKLTDDQIRLEGTIESMSTQMGRMTAQTHELRLEIGALRHEIEALRIAREAGV